MENLPPQKIPSILLLCIDTPSNRAIKFVIEEALQLSRPASDQKLKVSYFSLNF